MTPLDVARWLVTERGLSVIPCDHPGATRETDPRRIGKVPALPWKPYQARCATDAELVAWFGNGTPHNIGIVTGALSGIVAVDCDSPEAIAWADAHLPATPMATTTARGEHRYFQHPGLAVGNKAKIRTGDGRLALDVRGDGGYVLAPGSLHASGVRYARRGAWPPIGELPRFDPAWLAVEPPRATTPPSSDRAETTAEGGDVRARVRAYLAATPPAIEGQGGDAHTLSVCARVVRGFGLSEAETFDALEDWNARCSPPWTDDDLRTKIRNAAKYGDEPIGARRDRPRDTAPHDRRAREGDSHTTPDEGAPAAPILTRLDTVAPEAVSWLWPGRLARGKYTLLAGEPGVGKTYLALDAAARVTRGRAWPDGALAPSGDVLVLTAEDGLADTLRPRLDALGADVARVTALEAARLPDGTRRAVTLARDLDVLADAIRQVRPALVVIDPITAYLGRTDSHRDAEVRGVLAPLIDVIGLYGCALLAIGHLSKDAQRAALHRPGGSIAFVAAARLVLAVAADPQDAERRIVAPLKANLCRPAPVLAYRITDDALVWEPGPVEGLDAEALLRPAAPSERDDRTDAEAVIADMLGDTGAWPLDARDALAAGHAHGIHERTFQRAARRLGIRIARVGFGRNGRWVWHRPAIGDAIDDTSSRTDNVSSMSSMTPMAGKSSTTTIDDMKSAFTRARGKRGPDDGYDI